MFFLCNVPETIPWIQAYLKLITIANRIEFLSFSICPRILLSAPGEPVGPVGGEFCIIAPKWVVRQLFLYDWTFLKLQGCPQGTPDRGHFRFHPKTGHTKAFLHDFSWKCFQSIWGGAIFGHWPYPELPALRELFRGDNYIFSPKQVVRQLFLRDFSWEYYQCIWKGSLATLSVLGTIRVPSENLWQLTFSFRHQNLSRESFFIVIFIRRLSKYSKRIIDHIGHFWNNKDAL